MEPYEIASFLQKYADGTHTEAEHQQFSDWLKRAPMAAVEEAMEQFAAISHPHSLSTEAAATTRLANHIEASIDQFELGRHPAINRRGKLISWRTLTRAAAAVLLFAAAGMGAWWVIQKNKTGQSVAPSLVRKVKEQVKPGGNKATLILADGAVISLDDVKNGNIAQQGSAKVDKAGNGELVYRTVEGKPAEMLFNTLTTPRGGQFKLVLPDGSGVWLNAASSVKYPTAFTGTERRIEISGEAYFEVAHDAAKPFIVSVNGMEVRVLGTHFNINAYTDEASIKTSLLEGSVQLAKTGGSVTLVPGQQAQLALAGTLKVVNDVDMDEVVAWKNGYFSFSHADLQTVMRQIARWYDVDIRYEGRIPERFFGGKIDRSANATDVLRILEESKVHFTIENKKIIVKP